MDKTVPFGQKFHVGLYKNGCVTELEGYESLHICPQLLLMPWLATGYTEKSWQKR